MAPVIAEYMSEPVPAMTRAANVDALNSCSAYRIERRVHRAAPTVADGARAVQQVQEVAADRVVVGLDVDPPAVVAPVIPVQQHRAERGHQPVGDVARAGRAVVVAFGQHGARAPRRAVRITSIGCAAAGSLLQRDLHRRGNAAQRS